MSYKVVLPNGVVHTLDTDDPTIRYAAVNLKAGEVVGWAATKTIARSSGYATIEVWYPEEGDYILLPGDVLGVVTGSRGMTVYYTTEDGVEDKLHVMEAQGVVDPEVYIYVWEENGYTHWQVHTEDEILEEGHVTGSVVQAIRQTLATNYRPTFDKIPTSPGCTRHDIMAADNPAATGVYPIVSAGYGNEEEPVKKRFWQRGR